MEKRLDTSIRVKATSRGFLGGVQREAGDEFTIASAADFSPYWMERIGAGPDAEPTPDPTRRDYNQVPPFGAPPYSERHDA